MVQIGEIDNNATDEGPGNLSRHDGQSEGGGRVDAGHELRQGDGGVDIRLRGAHGLGGKDAHHNGPRPAPVDVDPARSLAFGALQEGGGYGSITENDQYHSSEEFAKNRT